jgi:hypothetical protein
VARASKPLTEGSSAVCARLLYLWAWVFVDVSWAEAIVVCQTGRGPPLTPLLYMRFSS